MDLSNEFENALIDAVADTLAAHGFWRRGRNLLRRRNGYVEHFNFQASRFNVPDIRCQYFLNVGVELPGVSRQALRFLRGSNGLREQRNGKIVDLVDYHPDIAWATRAHSLVESAPRSWIVEPETDFTVVKESIRQTVLDASDSLVPFASAVKWRSLPIRVVSAMLLPFRRRRSAP